MDWLPDIEQVHGTKDGGSMLFVPWRLVLHSTEGSSLDAAVASFRADDYWPHLTADPATRRIVQHLPFSRAGRALSHPSGTVDTNRARAIQIEIVGYAGHQPWPNDHVVWLGQTLAPIFAPGALARVAGSDRIGPNGPTFVGPDAGWIARADAPQRFTDEAWLRFPGVCGHQHVPHNDHWDPGAFDLDTFLAAAVADAKTKPEPVPAPAPEEDADMADPAVKKKGNPSVYIIHPESIEPMHSQAQLMLNVATGRARVDAKTGQPYELTDDQFKTLVGRLRRQK